MNPNAIKYTIQSGMRDNHGVTKTNMKSINKNVQKYTIQFQ